MRLDSPLEFLVQHSMALLVPIALSQTKALRDVVVVDIRVPASALEAIAPKNGRTVPTSGSAFIPGWALEPTNTSAAKF